MTRSLDDLLKVDEPFEPVFRDQLTKAKNDIRVLPADPAAGGNVLYRLQVTARSSASGTILSGGGLLVDHGWLRVFGAGAPDLPDMATASGFPDAPGDEQPVLPGLFLAIDVLGGQFAVDSGQLTRAPGEVCYWAPDSLEWTAYGMGQGDFLSWLCNGDLDGFYQDYRWPGWVQETEELPLDKGFIFYPPPFAEEFDLATASRAVVPVAEIVAFYADLASQLGGTTPLPWPQMIG
jgi:hypothetical protein